MVVHSTSSMYNDMGSFACKDGSFLANLNGTKLPSKQQTKCLAAAVWDGIDQVQCLKG